MFTKRSFHKVSRVEDINKSQLRAVIGSIPLRHHLGYHTTTATKKQVSEVYRGGASPGVLEELSDARESGTAFILGQYMLRIF
jgi:hypothetical protein